MKNNFTHIKYRGHTVPNIKRDISDPSLFRFLVKIKGKQFSKLFTAATAPKLEMVAEAVKALDVFREEKADYILWENKDNSKTVNDVWHELYKNKVRQKVWSENYRKNVMGFYSNHVAPVLGDLPISEIKTSHITNFMNGLKKLGSNAPLSKSSQKRAIEILTPVFEAAVENELIRENPIKRKHKVQRSRTEEKRIILAPDEEYQLTHEVLHRLFKHNPRVLVAFLFGFHGRRLSESLALKWTDVDFVNKKYIVRAATSKIKTDLIFDLPVDLEETLLRIRRGRKKFIFSSESSKTGHWETLSHYYKQIRVHVPSFGFHRMRNLLATTMAANGASVIEISEALGHLTPSTTQQYLTLHHTEGSKKINSLSEKILKRDKKPTDEALPLKDT